MNLPNLPKGIQDNIKHMEFALFGDFFSEGGKLFADNIRYQRLKNQIKIYNKAKAYTEEFGLAPNQINLNLLVPLLENISLESNDTVQDRWARIISNIRYSNTDQSFDLKCVEMMKNISDKELLLIDIIYELCVESREVKNKYYQKYPPGASTKTSSNNYFEYDVPFNKDLFSFTLYTLPYKLNTTPEMVELYMERLLSYHIFRPSLPTLVEDEDTYNDLRRSDGFEFTSFGLYFVELCKIPKAST